MSQPLLTIQIPYTEERVNDFISLCQIIGEQFTNNNDIQIQWDATGKEMTIGEKRELLYKKANGLFVWQIDSDDSIAPHSIELIINAIKSNHEVDCITFEERCQMNGSVYCSNHSLIYDDWEGDGSKLLSDGFHYHRTPFYKNVIKTSIAKLVPFEKIRYGEDHAWSRALKPLLHTEIHIPKQLYYYIYEPQDTPEERYGFNK